MYNQKALLKMLGPSQCLGAGTVVLAGAKLLEAAAFDVMLPVAPSCRVRELPPSLMVFGPVAVPEDEDTETGVVAAETDVPEMALTNAVSVAAADSSEAKTDAPMTVVASSPNPVKGLGAGAAAKPVGMVVMGSRRMFAP
ncbi:MAG: hypothetical protein Q9173_004770 [Seirophora scorigena]